MTPDTDAAEVRAALRLLPPTDAAHLDELHERFRAAARADGLVDIGYATVDSPVGALTLAMSDLGVVSVGWDEDDLLARLAEKVSPRIVAEGARLDPVRRQLDEYFEGTRRRFDVDIDWTLVKGFRHTVLEELRTVPFGAVVTYGELAERVHNPRASRAVGSAMATNPLPIIVPCHRVLRAGGQLGNYSGAGGVVTKQWLLDHEQGDGPSS